MNGVDITRDSYKNRAKAVQANNCVTSVIAFANDKVSYNIVYLIRIGLGFRV